MIQSATSIHWYCSWPTSQQSPFHLTSQQVSLTSYAYSYSHPSSNIILTGNTPHQEKRTSCDLLLHIHSKAGSSFLWLCHPLTVSPISLLLYVLSPASQVLLYFFKDSNSSLGYPLGCGHSPETHVPGLRQAFLAPRPGQSQATTVTWLSHQTPNCWFRTTTSVTLYTWIPSGCCDECLHIHTHSHTSTHTERRHLNEWIKEEQMAGLLPLKNTLVDFCLVWHLMSNLLPPYRLDLHPTLEHLQLRTPPPCIQISAAQTYMQKNTRQKLKSTTWNQVLIFIKYGKIFTDTQFSYMAYQVNHYFLSFSNTELQKIVVALGAICSFTHTDIGQVNRAYRKET